MDRVEFRVLLEPTEIDPLSRTIHPAVNGVLLRDLAKDVELTHATKDGQPHLAGKYVGLVGVERLGWPARHYLGEPLEQWFFDGDTILLGCQCGHAGCWPLTADVEVGRETVRWTRFRTGHRDWDLRRLGPFTFSRHEYQVALKATQVR